VTPDPLTSLRDVDPLDSRLVVRAGITGAAERPGGAGGIRPALTDPHTRTLILVPLGLVFGPSGMALLSAPALAFLEPLVSVALTVLGTLLGMAAEIRRPGAGRFGMAAVEGVWTAMLVYGGVAALYAVWGTPVGVAWALPALLGVCAAASFAPATSPGERHAGPVPTIGDFNSMLAVATGALVLGLARQATTRDAALTLGGLGLIALAIAGAGGLLVGTSSSDRERHTFIAGTLLLLGGSAAYLGSSALFVGLLAGVLWGQVGGAAGERIARDVQYVQHPLVVLLLVVAGARLVVTSEALVLALVYLCCRTAGKLSAGLWVARRAEARPAPVSGRPSALTAPGVVGMAIAIDVLQSDATGGHGSLLLAAVVLATLAIDAAHATARRFEGRA